MKASTQYHDFIGTAEADISDHTDLKEFLESKGVDTDIYNLVGISFYSGYSDFFTASIICEDKEESTESKKHIVSLDFEPELTKDEFFELFKRFHVVITEQFGNYEMLEIDKEITIRKEEIEE